MNNAKELERIFAKYDLKFTADRRKQLLERARSNEVEYILDYLINELKISPRNIEKCPSILYRQVSAVKENYEFSQTAEKTNITTVPATRIRDMYKQYVLPFAISGITMVV